MPQKCRTQHYKHKVSYLYLFSYIISTFGVKRCKILCFMKHFYPSLASSQVRVLQNKLNVWDHMSRDITMSQIVWMVCLWYFQKLIFQGTLFIIQFSKRLTYQTSSKLLFFLAHMNDLLYHVMYLWHTPTAVWHIQSRHFLWLPHFLFGEDFFSWNPSIMQPQV